MHAQSSPSSRHHCADIPSSSCDVYGCDSRDGDGDGDERGLSTLESLLTCVFAQRPEWFLRCCCCCVNASLYPPPSSQFRESQSVATPSQHPTPKPPHQCACLRVEHSFKIAGVARRACNEYINIPSSTTHTHTQCC